ncbi:MAG: site-specific integrase [Rhodanobacteraceae bacterium]
MATGRAERDIAADLRGALAPWKPRHFASITEPAKVGALLRAIDTYPGSFITRCALRLAPLVFVRPGELRKAEWREIDFSEALWSIPGANMKTGEPHLVPLSEQAMEILKEIEQLTGTGQYVFAGRKPNIPMSENTMNGALRTLGYSSKEFTPHGYRAMARTLLDEQLECRPEIIEHQLAHNVRDPLGRAYNRTKHLTERKQMMQAWGDYRTKALAAQRHVRAVFQSAP